MEDGQTNRLNSQKVIVDFQGQFKRRERILQFDIGMKIKILVTQKHKHLRSTENLESCFYVKVKVNKMTQNGNFLRILGNKCGHFLVSVLLLHCIASIRLKSHSLLLSF